MTSDCQWDMQAYQALLSDKTKIVAAAHITNVTATRQPVEDIILLAHQFNAICIIDGAQGIVHESVDVQELSCDFYVFSGHKLYAPTGIGALYGKQSILESMPVWHGGGKMVEKVSFEQTSYSALPGKFEAGTPNVAGAIALATAIEWLEQFDRPQVEAHYQQLLNQLIDGLNKMDGLRIVGLQPNASVVSFTLQLDGEDIHHNDIATLLDQQGIAVRSGHHCAHPLMDALGINGTVRVSLGVYNNEQDIDALLAALNKAIDLL